jgi:hypothetical protein
LFSPPEIGPLVWFHFLDTETGNCVLAFGGRDIDQEFQLPLFEKSVAGFANFKGISSARSTHAGGAINASWV